MAWGFVKHSILIADDSAVMRKTLRTFLEREKDWTVVGEAINGKEAVAKTKELNPDLVVLDVSMDEMNGLEATRELKKLRPSTPVVIFPRLRSLKSKK